MMKAVSRDDGWRLSDELWDRMTPLLPPPKAHPLGCHRPRIPNRMAMDAILLVLRTGMQWNCLGPNRDLYVFGSLPAVSGVD
jgi:hypothetical protein